MDIKSSGTYSIIMPEKQKPQQPHISQGHAQDDETWSQKGPMRKGYRKGKQEKAKDYNDL